MSMIGTQKAAELLGVSQRRVSALIESGKLKASRVGNMWVIAPADLEAVRVRKPGRPPAEKPAAKPAAKKSRKSKG